MGEPVTSPVSEFVHSHRCDYETSGECYCPTPAEAASVKPCGHLPEYGCECAEFEGDN